MKFFCVAFFALLTTARALNIPTFATADLVLGQPDFSTADLPAAPTAATLAKPSAVVVDPATGKVFVADTGNNRVLRYPSAARLRAGAEAEAVFGQPDFTSQAAALVSTSTLDSPTGLALDSSGRLWVADSNNHRVVMYPQATTTGSTPAAALVLGQASPSTATPATSQAGMKYPTGLWIDATGRLWVVDTGNNRVLRFDNVAAKTTGANADAVLGQFQFDTSGAGSSSQQLSDPAAVTMDANATLWVADRGNNRVLGYPSAGTVSSGTNASRILGQPDFNGSVSPGTTAQRISSPSGVFADAANNLWVLDQANNRILRFANLKSIENGKPATTVLGQSSFTSSATALDSRHVDTPFLGLFVQSRGQLWTSDRLHHRVLRFQPVDDRAPTCRITGKSRRITTSKRLKIRGTSSDDVAVTRITMQLVGQRVALARGTTRWSKTVRLAPGRNVIRAQASDASGKHSARVRVVIIRK